MNIKRGIGGTNSNARQRTDHPTVKYKVVNINNTRDIHASQPRKTLYNLNRALNSLNLKPLVAAVAPASGPSRPASPRKPLVRAYLFFTFSDSGNLPELKWTRKKLSFWKGLGQELENDCIKPLVRQLCGFSNSAAPIPSYDTFCRVSRQLDERCDLVDPVLADISRLMAAPPWILKDDSGKGEPKPKEAGKGKRGGKDKGKGRKKDTGRRDSNDYVKNRLKNDMSIIEFFSLFPNDTAAMKWLEAQRWPEGVRCPRCGSPHIAETNSRSPKQPYRCRPCRYDFSVKTGTVMHSSNVSCQKWLLALYYILKPKGASALDLAGCVDVSYDTALHLSHRIRVAFLEDTVPSSGAFQFDEAYFGGRPKNQHNKLRKIPKNRDKKKVQVIGCLKEADEESNEISRIRLKILESATKEEAEEFVRCNALPGSETKHDGNSIYEALGKDYDDTLLNHSAGEYVKDNGDTTNQIEGVWSVCKRMIYGTHSHVSSQLFPLYLAEIMWRWNHRNQLFLVRMEQVAGNFMRRRLTEEDMRHGEGLALHTAEQSNEGKAVQGNLIIDAAERDWNEAVGPFGSHSQKSKREPKALAGDGERTVMEIARQSSFFQ